MTKIVAGSLGGRNLQVPRKGTRPTAERVREALFSMLTHLDGLENARVLDVFAGSGALGFEALSRGACSCVFVEKSASACAVLNQNIVALNLRAHSQVFGFDAIALTRPSPFGPVLPFHLLFFDPPYDYPTEKINELLLALEQEGLVAQDALIVVERRTGSPTPIWPSNWRFLKERTWGETSIFLAEKPTEEKAKENPRRTV